MKVLLVQLGFTLALLIAFENVAAVEKSLKIISANQSDFVQMLQNATSLDICFLVDLTWSMEPYLQGIMDWVGELVGTLNVDPERHNRKQRFSIIGYRDIEDDVQFEILNFTSNKTEFDIFLRSVTTDGGGDIPEDVYGALVKVLKLGWSDGESRKAVFHFTDAPCHAKSCRKRTRIKSAGESYDTVLAKMKKKKIEYYFGQISNRTNTMLAWFQNMYGKSIPIFDLGFDHSSYSINNSKISTFVTVEDIKNAKILSQRLKEGSVDIETFGASMNASGMLWSENLFEGDIDLRGMPVSTLVDSIDGEPVPEMLSDFANLDNAVAEKLKLWPNAIVPYIISTKFTTTQRAFIALAIDNFHTLTCIRWLAGRSTEEDYVKFELGPSTDPICRSAVGRVKGSQDILLSAECFSQIGVVMHEMMHAIGFIHEQSRRDRDDYVTIQWNNLPHGEDNKNFQTYGVDKIDNLDTNYDYSSVMHYPQRIGGIEIIVPLINVQIGQREKLSETDVYKINKLYSCLNEKDITPLCDISIECARRAQEGQCQTDPAMIQECERYCMMCHKGIKGREKINVSTITSLLTSSSTKSYSPSVPSNDENVTPTELSGTIDRKQSPNEKESENTQSAEIAIGQLFRGVDTEYIACNFTQLPTAATYQFFAAINDQQYRSGQACGSCMELTNSVNESIVVYIIDQCSDCEPGSFVASDAAFSHLQLRDRPADGVLSKIKSRLVPCPNIYVSTSIEIYTMPGSNVWWAAFQPRSMRNPITGMSLLRSESDSDDDWKEMQRCCGGGYFAYSDAPTISGSFKLKLQFVDLNKIDAGPQELVVDIFQLIAGSVISTGAQN